MSRKNVESFIMFCDTLLTSFSIILCLPVFIICYIYSMIYSLFDFKFDFELSMSVVYNVSLCLYIVCAIILFIEVIL